MCVPDAYTKYSNLHGCPSSVVGSEDAETPDGEASNISISRKIECLTARDSECISYNRKFLHMILYELRTSDCSVQILGVLCEFEKMSR